jgi:hypothetical protein
MAKSKNPPSAEGVKVDVSDKLNDAKPISDITDKWYGVSPSELQEGLTSQQLGQVDLENLIDKGITVLGFHKREGKIKGKTTEYMIIMAVPEGQNFPIVFMTGGQVICRKLQKAADENSLPVKGHISYREGADFPYYDFTN